MNRRFFLGGLLSTPAIVHSQNLMPIFSRNELALAWNCITDSYDVVLPSGIIKPEGELWNKKCKWVEHYKYISKVDNKEHVREIIHISNEEIAKWRSQYKVIGGIEKRRAYSFHLNKDPIYTERLFETIDERSKYVSDKSYAWIKAHQHLPYNEYPKAPIEEWRKQSLKLVGLA